MNRDNRQPDINENEAREAVIRLSHFDPTYVDAKGNQVADYLVLDALATFGPLIIVQATEVKEHIKKIFLLEFEEGEIESSVQRLTQKKQARLLPCAKGERLQFQIMEAAASMTRDNMAALKKLEDDVLEAWKEELFEKYEEYPVVKDNIGKILQNLRSFVVAMFVRHGMECVAVLYPDDPKTIRWLDSIGGHILAGLPNIDPTVDAILRLEIPRFLKSTEPGRTAYIANLFNSSYLWHLMQVDDKCSRMLQSVTRGQTLFLDNNILYSLVGFDGVKMLNSTNTMLTLARKLGYELAVTTKTVEEFHASLEWQMRELGRKPPLPRELARLAAEILRKTAS